MYTCIISNDLELHPGPEASFLANRSRDHHTACLINGSLHAIKIPHHVGSGPAHQLLDRSPQAEDHLAMSAFLLLPLLGAAIAAEAPEKASLEPEKKTYTYKSIGDCSIQADVYRPADDRVHPAIFWIHGGALIGGHRGNISTEQARRYLGEGWVVVSIDYRLAPETKLASILEDVDDAYRWVREKGPELFRVAPDRIAVVGPSAGGYLTLVSGYRFKPRPRALVAFYGYGDIAGDWYTKPDPFYAKQPAVPREEAYRAVGEKALSGAPGPNERMRFYLFCRQQGLWTKEVAGHDPAKGPQSLEPFCPIRNVTRDYPPALLLHGDKDTDVPFAQSEQMAQELKRQGVEHKFIPIPGGPHGFDRDIKSPQVAAAFEEVLTFLRKQLK